MAESIFWFRRDLRLHDNAGLFAALKASTPVRAIFIFDSEILQKLKNPKDIRLPFLYDQVIELKAKLNQLGSDLEVYHGSPNDIFIELLKQKTLAAIYLNHDYEPSAMKRDQVIQKLCSDHRVEFHTFKDHVIFEKEEILSQSEKPYLVYTPYKKKWLQTLNPFFLKSYPSEDFQQNFKKIKKEKLNQSITPTLADLGFIRAEVFYPSALLPSEIIKNYETQRNFPAINGTSKLGLHLRFGTISIRDVARESKDLSAVYLSELVWRDFFIQILYHFPHVETSSFRPQYEKVEWRENRSEFNRWSEGMTGYPLVDAGMRELNATGFMHNRVRMVTASFLCKHLLMHWLKGERYFASLLLDYELAVNNGNWQWVAGTGCDAAPYFRIFNPEIQRKKFDPKDEYIKKWIPEFETSKYPRPMIEHREATVRATRVFNSALK